MTDKQPQDKHPDNDPIVPIDFTPAGKKRGGFRFKLSPARIAVAAVALIFAGAAWFVLTAKSVFLDVSPAQASISLASPLAIPVGERYLIRRGDVDVRLTADGYYDLETTLTVEEAQAQTFRLDMTRLPGFLDLSTVPVDGAEVIIDGESIGTTPLDNIELAAGEHTLMVALERYEGIETTVDIEGRSTQQALQLELLPFWADVSFDTAPAGATVYVNGEERGLTPLTTEILQGEHEVLVKLPAHKAWTEELDVLAREDISLPLIELEAADGLVLLQSTPSNAGVLLNGNYQGQTPLEIAVTPEQDHTLTFFSNGYQQTVRNVRLEAESETALNVELDPITQSVEISVSPAEAELYVNGEFKGNANQTLELLAASQEIEIRAEGHVPYVTTFISRPGLEQKLNVDLMTLEEQRLASIEPEITTVNGQRLKLLYPGNFTMGASRREAGRQANEMLRDVSLSKPYYLSLTEVTNAQFAEFDSEHSSGVVEGRTLSNNMQPVVRVSWQQAALYCNWLSQQESLPPFYTVEGGEVTGFNPDSTGYRLPTEAEWAWAARVAGEPDSLLKFPWGPELPPPENHGNYADITAGVMLGRILPDYNDSFLLTAPVATFPANANGFYDMGGNVAEWTHDFYGATVSLSNDLITDPMGPDTGTYHVVRGSSWAHGTITELRLSYRDYGSEPRDDVGFRVARYLGE